MKRKTAAARTKAPAKTTAKSSAKFTETLLGGAIGWGRARGKERGVFARRAIRAGTLIELAPVVPMSKKHIVDGRPPDGYVLEWREDRKDEEYALVLGYVMLYNHSKTPNLHLETDFRSQAMKVTALRDIKAGEELTWNYNCEIWFDAV